MLLFGVWDVVAYFVGDLIICNNDDMILFSVFVITFSCMLRLFWFIVEILLWFSGLQLVCFAGFLCCSVVFGLVGFRALFQFL